MYSIKSSDLLRILDVENTDLDSRIMILSSLYPKLWPKIGIWWRPSWNPKWLPLTLIEKLATTFFLIRTLVSMILARFQKLYPKFLFFYIWPYTILGSSQKICFSSSQRSTFTFSRLPIIPFVVLLFSTSFAWWSYNVTILHNLWQ